VARFGQNEVGPEDILSDVHCAVYSKTGGNLLRHFDNRAFELPIFPGDGLQNDGATRSGLEGAGYRPLGVFHQETGTLFAVHLEYVENIKRPARTAYPLGSGVIYGASA
jgi:hypothetical protein